MILGILQARTSSSRLPGKVLLPIVGRPMLALQIERMLRARRVDRWVLATSTNAEDDALEGIARSAGVDCFRGSLDDVLDRFYRAAERYAPEHVVRTTGDCPLFDPEVLDVGIAAYLSSGVDYLSNCVEATYPDGLDYEVFRFSALEEAWKEARLPSQREHVTPFINRQPDRFSVKHFRNPAGDFSSLRWTVDQPEDLPLVRSVYEALYASNPQFGLNDVLRYLESRPTLSEANSGVKRNEGYQLSLDRERGKGSTS